MKRLAILLFIPVLLVACRPPTDGGSARTAPPGVTVDLSLDGPARVGTVPVQLEVSGTSAQVSSVSFTGDMTHAGMVPVIVEGIETAPGVWRADDFAFHMGGDWFVLAEIGLEDGSGFEATLPVNVSGN